MFIPGTKLFRRALDDGIIAEVYQDKYGLYKSGANGRQGRTYRLRIKAVHYGHSGRSASAVRNLAGIYKEYPHESYSFEIIDLLDNRRLAQEDNITAIPTLMLKDQKGAKRLVGDLSNIDMVVKWLGL